MQGCEDNMPDTPKRQITPHKGGRTERLFIRITPASKERLQAICETQDISTADWIEQQLAANQGAEGEKP